MRKVLEMIWGARLQKYFCREDSTQKCLTGKSAERQASTHHTVLLIHRAASGRRPRSPCRRRVRPSHGLRFIPTAAIGSITTLTWRLCREAKVDQIVVGRRGCGMVEDWVKGAWLDGLKLKGFNYPGAGS